MCICAFSHLKKIYNPLGVPWWSGCLDSVLSLPWPGFSASSRNRSHKWHGGAKKKKKIPTTIYVYVRSPGLSQWIMLIIHMWTWVPLMFFLTCDSQKWEGVFNLLWFDCFRFEWLVLYFVILLSKSSFFFFFYPCGIRIVSNTFFEVF